MRWWMFTKLLAIVSRYILVRYPAVCQLLFSHSVVTDSLVTAWTIAYQTPLSMRFSRQEYWGGLPFPSPGGLPHPGIETVSLGGGFFTAEPITSK